MYVATPQLLRAYGITAAQVSPDADILTMRPGLPSMTNMQFLYGATKFGPPVPNSPCPPSYCLANPKIQEVSALPSGTSAPNTVITEHAVRQFHLTTTTAGWLIQAPGSLTAGQISAAQHAAAAAGLTVETRNSIPTSAEILDVATVFGILLALGILAMSVGLLRSETASNLRTLTATGAGSTARRAISAATAGALALIGAVVGIVAGYIAAIGFFRTSQLDTLSSLTSIPVANLLLILVGMPLVAVTGGWLLAGREPSAIGRRPRRASRSSRARHPAAASALADVGRQVLIGGEELAPPRVGVAALTPGKVGGEIFDVDLHPAAVGGELVQGHAPFLPDQDGLVAVGGQRDLDDLLVRLARLHGQQQQPPRRLARFHAPGAFPSAGKKARAELTAEAEVALDLAHPAGKTAGIGECRPQVVDVGVEAVLDAHDALAIC